MIFLFVKPKRGSFDQFSRVASKRCFPEFFFVRASKIDLNTWGELTDSESDAPYERKLSSLNTLFENIRRINILC